MIPLRDTMRPHSVPFVTYALLIANVAVFLHEVSLGPALEAFLFTYGLIPRDFAFVSLFTSMFLHAGWMHLLGNMLYLHIFGDNVEDRMGHARFLGMYLLAGVVAGLAQVMINSSSAIPMVGASGAIAGVTGAYMLFFPRARIVTLVPVFVFVQIMEVPAVFFLFIWFAYQLMLGVGSLGSEAMGGVAFWAHIGGFVAGMLVGPLLAAPRRSSRMAWEDGALRRIR
jgi:membrane associated rhomboid family serine protease